MTLSQYFQILRKRWLTVVTCAVLGILVSIGITLTMPNVYAATATSFVTMSSGGPQAGTLAQNSQLALANVSSFSGLVNSPSVLQPVIDDLHLNTTPAQLAASITATNPPGTVLIVVEAKSGSADQARSIADDVSRNLGITVDKLTKSKTGGTSQVSLSVATRASTPSAPASPRPILNVALGTLLGLFVGACLAVIREHFDTSIKSQESLQKISGVAPLGAIPFTPSISDQPLVLLSHHGDAVESFRTIRTNLRFVDVDNPPRQVVITSAVSGEGKSVTACNLALALAQGARNVCLVEADLRRPKTCSYLGINGAIGLTNVVTGQYALDEVLVPWKRGQITVLPAGTTPPDPSQLLGSHAVQDIFARLRERFDFVIIDSPPVLPVSDAAVLSAGSDGAVLVVRQGVTHRDKVASAIEQLQTAHTHLIGTVLSGVREPRGSAVYAYENSYEVSGGVADSSFSTGKAHADPRHALGTSSDIICEATADQSDPNSVAFEHTSVSS